MIADRGSKLSLIYGGVHKYIQINYIFENDATESKHPKTYSLTSERDVNSNKTEE